jgi:hypothetical protein
MCRGALAHVRFEGPGHDCRGTAPSKRAGNGGKPLMVLDGEAAVKLTGPAAIDGIGPSDGWQASWQKTDLARRQKSSWARAS